MKLAILVLAGAVTLPLQQLGNWQILQFSKIEANTVSFDSQGMTVRVENSASPVIYPLDEPILVSRVAVDGRLDGLLQLDSGKQGDGDHDDFALKIGLVIAGDKTLNGLQKMFSPDWIVTLFELAPEGAGVDTIYFLNAVQNAGLLGRKRQHPLSELIYENNVWLLDRTGPFQFNHKLDEPLKVIAVWVSIDGDNSGSDFTTRITQLRLES